MQTESLWSNNELVTMNDIINGDLKIAHLNRPWQTWNLSKILHTQIFRLKVLHRKSA